jgi:hypothetical protein
MLKVGKRIVGDNVRDQEQEAGSYILQKAKITECGT